MTSSVMDALTAPLSSPPPISKHQQTANDRALSAADALNVSELPSSLSVSSLVHSVFSLHFELHALRQAAAELADKEGTVMLQDASAAVSCCYDALHALLLRQQAAMRAALTGRTPAPASTAAASSSFSTATTPISSRSSSSSAATPTQESESSVSSSCDSSLTPFASSRFIAAAVAEEAVERDDDDDDDDDAAFASQFQLQFSLTPHTERSTAMVDSAPPVDSSLVTPARPAQPVAAVFRKILSARQGGARQPKHFTPFQLPMPRLDDYSADRNSRTAGTQQPHSPVERPGGASSAASSAFSSLLFSPVSQPVFSCDDAGPAADDSVTPVLTPPPHDPFPASSFITPPAPAEPISARGISALEEARRDIRQREKRAKRRLLSAGAAAERSPDAQWSDRLRQDEDADGGRFSDSQLQQPLSDCSGDDRQEAALLSPLPAVDAVVAARLSAPISSQFPALCSSPLQARELDSSTAQSPSSLPFPSLFSSPFTPLSGELSSLSFSSNLSLPLDD